MSQQEVMAMASGEKFYLYVWENVPLAHLICGFIKGSPGVFTESVASFKTYWI